MMLMLLSDPDIRGGPSHAEVDSQGSCTQGGPLMRAALDSPAACHQQRHDVHTLRSTDEDDACFEDFCLEEFCH